MYALRITITYFKVEKLPKILDKYLESYLVFEEQATHPHFHGAITIKPEQTDKRFRDALRECIIGNPPKGHKVISLKKVRDEKQYLKYIAKEGNCKYNNTFYDPKQLQQEYLSKNKKTKEHKGKLIDAYRKVNEDITDLRQICINILKYNKEHKQLQPSEFLLQRYAFTICIENEVDNTETDKEEEEKYSKLLQRFYNM